MGASTSSSTADDGSTLAPIFESIQEKVAFEKIISTTPALYEDAAYHTVLAAPRLFPQLTQLQMELLTREYGEMLAQNSLKSGNFCVLLRYVIQALPFSRKVVTMTNRELGALAPHQVGAASIDQKLETIDTYLHRAVNALFFVRQFVMRFVERMDACSLLAHFNNPLTTECAGAQSSAASRKPETLLFELKDMEECENEFLLADLSKNLAARFLDALVTVLADYAPSPQTYELHVEVVNTLLVLLSPVVYPRDHSQQFGDTRLHNPFLYMLMKFTSPTRASSAVDRLLRNIIERLPATGSSSVSNTTVIAKKMAHEMSLITMSGLSNLADEQEQFSYFTLEGFGSIAASIFRFPWRFFQYFTTHEKTASPLADRSALLLLVLLQSCRDSDSLVATNPFREALCGLMDNADLESIKTEKGGQRAQSTQQSDTKLQSSTEKVELIYSDLFQVIGRFASYETSHLILYTLLYSNSMMLDFAVNKLGMEHLLLPLLETLYHAQSVEPSRLYMLVIVLLTFTQDASFVRTAHTQLVLPAVAWYQEHYMLDVSLGSLLMIIFTRLIYRNITHFQDSFIHVNAFAALSNLARSAENLHMYAAQGVVGLIDLLAKNEAKLGVQMQRVQGVTREQSDVLAQKRAAYVEFIHLLLSVLSSCLKAKLLPRNPQLIYALLHRADTFGLLQKHSEFVAHVKNSPVWSTVAHFQALVRAKTLPDDVLDADSVLTIIRAECVSLLAAFSASSRTGDVSRSRQSVNDDDASYRYEEEVDPEQYFVPYIWKLIQEQTVDFCWKVDKITLFVPSRTVAATTIVVQ